MDYHSRQLWFSRVLAEGHLGSVSEIFEYRGPAGAPSQKGLLDLSSRRVRLCDLYDDGTVIDQGKALLKLGDRAVWASQTRIPPLA